MPIEDPAFCRPLLAWHVGTHRVLLPRTKRQATVRPKFGWNSPNVFRLFPVCTRNNYFLAYGWWMEDTGGQNLACQAKRQSQRHIREAVRVTGAKIVYWKSFITFIVHKSSMAHPGPVETHYWSASLLCPKASVVTVVIIPDTEAEAIDENVHFRQRSLAGSSSFFLPNEIALLDGIGHSVYQRQISRLPIWVAS